MPNEELTVYYPGGESLQVFGRFVKHGKVTSEQNARYGVAVESLESVVVFGRDAVSPGSILLLDTRCVVQGRESGVIYTPRPYMQQFPGEMREWMENNPTWPSRLNLEVESSYPDRGSRDHRDHEPE